MEEYANIVEIKPNVSIPMYLQKERNVFSTSVQVGICIVHIQIITEKSKPQHALVSVEKTPRLV